MEEPMLGSIILFAGNFPPRGWALCNGQLMGIQDNQALFAILGATYGGDGRTTFALPDLRSRVPVHFGRGPGLSERRLGQRIGTEDIILNITQIPSHNHEAALTDLSVEVDVDLKVSDAPAVIHEPTDNVSLAAGIQPEGRTANPVNMYNEETPNIALKGVGSTDTRVTSAKVITGHTGGNRPITNMQPSLGINYIIALQGFFPSKN